MAKKTKKQVAKDIELVMLMDRSGSMSAIQHDMEGAINTYIADQKKNFPNTKLTFAQFDVDYEILYFGVKITDVSDIKLKPRGCTALLDAIGRTINEAKARIEKEKTDPQLLFVIVTDGEENSSTEFTKDVIFKMISDQKANAWDFVFLGANQDAIQQGGNIGISAGKCLTYKTSSKGIGATGQSLCCYTQGMRASFNADSVSFTNKDRQDQENS